MKSLGNMFPPWRAKKITTLFRAIDALSTSNDEYLYCLRIDEPYFFISTIKLLREKLNINFAILLCCMILLVILWPFDFTVFSE